MRTAVREREINKKDAVRLNDEVERIACMLSSPYGFDICIK